MNVDKGLGIKKLNKPTFDLDKLKNYLMNNQLLSIISILTQSFGTFFI